MSETSGDSSEWMSLPEVAETLEIRLREVRGMLVERRLIAVRRGESKAWSIPAEFLTEDPTPVPLASLRGSVMQLGDAGMTDEEIFAWLFSYNDELAERPIDSLRRGRTHAVRRAAQTLAF